jgi:hypothetical protein
VWEVWEVCGVCWGCGRCGGVGSLLTFDIPQTALFATLDTYTFIYSTRSIPTSLFMSNLKPSHITQFKLFGAIMTKMELFWSSTYFFMTPPFLCRPPLPKRARNLTMLWFSVQRLSWWFSISFSTYLVNQWMKVRAIS